MAINNIFANNIKEAKIYCDLVESLMRHTSNGQVIPYYYYVPKDLIEFERVKPNSQVRLPSPEINNGSIHLWTQSVWLICQLLGLYLNFC